MRQNVIKAAPFEAATARQRACVCKRNPLERADNANPLRSGSAGEWLTWRRCDTCNAPRILQRTHVPPLPPTLGISRHVLIVMLFRRLLSIGPRREQPKRERERGGTRSVHCHSLCGTCTNWKQNSNKIWLVFCVPTHETRAGTATGTESELALGAWHCLATGHGHIN